MKIFEGVSRAAKLIGANVLGRTFGWIGSALFWASAGRIDWNDKAGLKIDNSAVWSILSYVINSGISDSLLVVQKRKNGNSRNDWIDDTSPEATRFLRSVSAMKGGYSATQLFASVVLGIGFGGNAYWLKIRAQSGDVVGYQPLVPQSVTPKRDKDFRGPYRWSQYREANGLNPITYYEVSVDGRSQEIAVEEIVHFRYLVDMSEPALGVSPFWGSVREICLDNDAATSNSSLIANGGALGFVWSPSKDVPPPNPAQQKEIKDQLYAQMRGAATSAGAFMPVPGDFQKLGITPDELAIDKTRSGAIARVAAGLNIDLMALGLPSDNKTYSNFEEADEQGFRKASMPFIRLIGDTLTEQVAIPDFGLTTKRVYWSFKEVPAMQPDLDKLHDRHRKDWLADLIDRATWKERIGEEPGPGDTGVYYSQVKAASAPKPEPKPKADEKTSERSLLKRLRELEKIDA